MICRDDTPEREAQKAGVKPPPPRCSVRDWNLGFQASSRIVFVILSAFFLHAAVSSVKPKDSAILAPRSKATWHNAAEYVNGRGDVRTSQIPWSGLRQTFPAAVMSFLNRAHSLGSIDP